VKQEREEGTFRREKLPGRFTTRKLFGWSDKRYDQEYWGTEKKLEMVERKVIRGKKNKNNCKERRNQRRKFRS